MAPQTVFLSVTTPSECRSTDIYLFFVVPLPALVVGIGYVAYSALAMGGPGRIGHEAHLGGAVTGAVIGLLMALG